MARGGILVLLLALAGPVSDRLVAQAPPALADQRRQLLTARQESAAAAARADRLAAAAATERSAADRAATEEAALAARVTAAEADLAAAQARVAIVDDLIADSRARLGVAQMPVARLLAALESLARRPSVAAIAQPGSIDDLVHIRAVLGSTLPVVRARTTAVRAELAETRRLQAAAATAAAALHDGRAYLLAERVALASLEARHRSRATALRQGAISESDRALALGERARDLVDGLVESGAAQATATDLAMLAGPEPRPLAVGALASMGALIGGSRRASGSASGPTLGRGGGIYRIPVSGRLVGGFEELSDAGFRARGLTFAVAPRAGVEAPAAGTVRYARAFRGYGVVVIIDHGDGWSTTLTGLESAIISAGATVARGTPVGVAVAADDAKVTVELRRRGQPVDITALLG